MFFRVKKVVVTLTRCRCAPTPVCIRTAYERPCRLRTLKILSSVSQSETGDGLWKHENNQRSMHLYPRRRNVAAQVAEELKTVTYAIPPMEERRKKRKKKTQRLPLLTGKKKNLSD